MLARYIIAVIGLCAAIFSAGVFMPAAHADSNCNDAAACMGSLDDGNPGNNQGGDAAPERERPDDKRDRPQ